MDPSLLNSLPSVWGCPEPLSKSRWRSSWHHKEYTSMHENCPGLLLVSSMEVVQISIWALISDSQEVISWNVGNWVWMQSWVEHPAQTLGSLGSSRALGLWRGEQLQRSPKCLLHDSGCVWWPCLASFYAYQALYQMLTWLHPQYLLFFFNMAMLQVFQMFVFCSLKL